MLYISNNDNAKIVCSSFSIKERSVIYTLSINDPLIEYISISSNPNVKLDGQNIVAIKDIGADEEISL